MSGPLINGELRGARLEMLASDPSDLKSRIWFNSTANVAKFFDGTLKRIIVDRDYLATVALANPMSTPGDIIYGGAAGAVTRLPAGASNTVLIGGASPAFAKIVDANVDPAAAIAQSKILNLTADLTSITNNITTNTNNIATNTSNINTLNTNKADATATAAALAGKEPTITVLPLTKGGTGQSTATLAFLALAPAVAGQSGKFLTNDGTNVSWATVSGGGGGYTVSEVTADPGPAVNNTQYLANTNAAPFSITLPTLVVGAKIKIQDAIGTWDVKNLTIVPASGERIYPLAANVSLVCNVIRGWIELIGKTGGWSPNSLASTTLGSGGSGMTPLPQTASFTATNYSINHIDHTAGGIIIGTLPSTTAAAVVTFVYAKGNVDTSANYFVAAPSPTGGTDAIDGNVIGDGEAYKTTLYAVTYSKAAGASVWYGQYQRISVAPPASATESGLVSGEITPTTVALTVTNLSGTTTVSAVFSRTGKSVTMMIPAIASGTASAGGINFTGIPTQFQFSNASIALPWPSMVVAGSGQHGQLYSNSTTSFSARSTNTSGIVSGTFQTERAVYFTWTTA